MLLMEYNRDMLNVNSANIFIKGLSSNETNKSFYELFSKYGEIFSSKVVQDYLGHSKGYGFIQYKDPKSAEEVISKCNGMNYNDKTLTLELYKKRTRLDSAFTNIYIKNLPSSITTKEDLANLFSCFGEQTSIAIANSTLKN